jgi:hypothetical protein
MKIREVKVLCIMLFACILCSCAPGQIIGPTIKPTITPIVIKEGRWSNSSDDITFNVKENKIINMDLFLRMGNNSCKIKVEEILNSATLFIKYDWWEDIYISPQQYSLMGKLHIPTPVSKDTGEKILIRIFSISGSFMDSTSMSGTYQLVLCGESLGNINEGFTAKWKG